jgi:WD40 repeat protein
LLASCIRFHPKEPNVLFSAGWDRQVIEWDLEKMVVKRFFSGPYVCGDGLDIHPDGDRLLTASYRKDNTVELWSRDPCKQIGVMAPTDGGMAYGCCFRPTDPQYVCVAGVDDFQLRLIDVVAGKSCGRIKREMAFYTCAFSSDGAMIVGAGVGGKVVFARVHKSEHLKKHHLPDLAPTLDDPAAASVRMEMHKRSIEAIQKSIAAEHVHLDLEPAALPDHGSDSE